MSAPLLSPVPALHTVPPDAPVSKRRYIAKWDGGPAEYMRMGQSLVKKRPTEHRALKHLSRPDDDEFVLPPERTDRHVLWCYACEQFKAPEEFHRNASQTWRLGRHTACKACRKLGKSKPKTWTWYRSTPAAS